MALLSDVCGSSGLAAVVAVLVIDVPGAADEGTTTTSVTVALAPTASKPVQLISPLVGPTQLRPLADTDAKLVPAGTESLTTVSVVALGPWFVTVIV